MNKAKHLQKKLVKTAATGGAIVAVAIGAVVGSGMLADKELQRKNQAETSRSSDNSQIVNMRNQIDQSGDAEKRFLEISLSHTNPDFSANPNALKKWLRAMKDQYRFSDSFKLTMALPKPADKPEFSTLNFDVSVREPLKLELGAMSDVHVFSFLDQLQRDMPGLVRVSKFTAQRRADYNSSTYRDFSSGVESDFVGAEIEFSWIGITPKAKDPAASPANEPPGGM